MKFFSYDPVSLHQPYIHIKTSHSSFKMCNMSVYSAVPYIFDFSTKNLQMNVVFWLAILSSSQI